MTVEPGDLFFSDLQDYVERTFAHVAESRGLAFNLNLSPGLPPSIYTDAFTVHSDGGNQTVTLTAIVAPPPNVTITPLHTDLVDPFW